MRPLGELEAVVMDHMWAVDDALAVREVLERMDRQPPLAYTTVLTVMDNLYRKGFLDRDKDGRAWRYRPTKGRAEHTADLMHELLSDSGDSSSTLLRFLDRMSPTEVERLRRAIGD